MVRTLTRQGNSLALVIERPLRELLDIEEDTPLKLSIDGRRLIVEPMTQVEPRSANGRVGMEELWGAIGAEFNKLGLPFRTTGRSRNNWLMVPIRDGEIHYEWFLRRREKCIDVAIHFQSEDLESNLQRLEPFRSSKAVIEAGIEVPLKTERFGKNWSQVRFPLPYDGTQPVRVIAPRAASLMKILIDRTWPIVEKLKARD